MVMAEDSIGMPARKAATRATFIPCSPSGMAQPIITSSTSFLSRPGTRPSAPWMATAARSSGRVARNIPLGALPTAVRTALTITASLMDVSPQSEKTKTGMAADKTQSCLIRVHRRSSAAHNFLIPQRAAALQCKGDALLGFLFAAKREERFPLQIQQILLAHQGAGSDRAAAQNVRHPTSDLRVVVADEFALPHHVDPE